MDQVSLKSCNYRLRIFYLLVLNGDGDFGWGFYLLCFPFFSLILPGITTTARPPKGQTFLTKDDKVRPRTHQGFPTEEGDAALDSVACTALPVTVHCCVEFQETSGCTFQKRVTYSERKENKQAIKYSPP